MLLLVPGEYSEVLRILFRRGEDGRVAFGPAQSMQSILSVSSFEALEDWLEFDDYIMEGNVRYDLRARPHPRGLLLEIRLKGSARDKHVGQFVGDYVRWAGLCPKPA